MKNRVLISFAISLLLALNINFIGASQAQAAAKRYSLTVTIENMYYINTGLPSCSSLNTESAILKQYVSITANDRMTVKNSKGKTIGTGKLRFVDSSVSGKCLLTVKVKNLAKSDFYEIKIGSKPVMEYSFEELVDENWELNFSI